MFRRFSNKALLIVALVLGALFFLTSFLQRNKPIGNFNTNIVNIDTATIDFLSIEEPKENKNITLTKQGKTWYVKSESGEQLPCSRSYMQQFLGQLQTIKAQSLIAQGKDSWAEYEVEESNGTIVNIKQGGNELARFIVGKFDYTEATGVKTYMRPAGDDNVYVVEGFFKSTFTAQISNFVDNTILKFKNEELLGLTFNYNVAEGSFNVSAKDGQWFVNETPADSAKTIEAITAMNNVIGPTTLTQFSTDSVQNILTLRASTTAGNSTIQCYQGKGKEMYFHSSTNPQVYFKDGGNVTQGLLMKSVGNFIDLAPQ